MGSGGLIGGGVKGVGGGVDGANISVGVGRGWRWGGRGGADIVVGVGVGVGVWWGGVRWGGEMGSKWAGVCRPCRVLWLRFEQRAASEQQ